MDGSVIFARLYQYVPHASSSGSKGTSLVAFRSGQPVGSRTFTVSGTAVWNDLPAHVTATPSLAVFRQRLKTFLFSRSYPDIVI